MATDVNGRLFESLKLVDWIWSFTGRFNVARVYDGFRWKVLMLRTERQIRIEVDSLAIRRKAQQNIKIKKQLLDG